MSENTRPYRSLYVKELHSFQKKGFLNYKAVKISKLLNLLQFKSAKVCQISPWTISVFQCFGNTKKCVLSRTCFCVCAVSATYERTLSMNYKASQVYIVEFDCRLPGLSDCRLFQKAAHIITYCVRQLPSHGIWWPSFGRFPPPFDRHQSSLHMLRGEQSPLLNMAKLTYCSFKREWW
jgi:hypothetical protein